MWIWSFFCSLIIDRIAQSPKPDSQGHNQPQQLHSVKHRAQISPWSSSLTQIHSTHPCPSLKFLLHGSSMGGSRMTEEAFGNSFLYGLCTPSFWAESVYVSLVNLHTWEVLTFHITQRVQQSFGICRIHFQNFFLL